MLVKLWSRALSGHEDCDGQYFTEMSMYVVFQIISLWVVTV
jgi:hypothetical protein